MKFSKIAMTLALGFAAQAASAGIITVVIDDFSSAAGNASNGNRSGSFTVGSGQAATAIDGAYPTSPIFSISVGSLPTSGATYVLNYDGISLPHAATPGSLSFTTLWNNYGNSNGGTPNTVAVNGGAAAPLTTGDVVYSAYAGGPIALTFNAPPTRSWDILIDNVTVSFECANTKDTSMSLAAFMDSQTRSCANVPVPGSLALLGLGGVAAGLVSRRRAAK